MVEGEIIPGRKNTMAISDFFGCDFYWLKHGIGEPFKDITKRQSHIDNSKHQTAKKRSKIINSEGSMTRNSGTPDSPQLTNLELEFIEMNREYGNDAMLGFFD